MAHDKKNVKEYIDDSPDFAKPILRKLRKTIRKAAPNADETLKWNNPFYGLKRFGLGVSNAHKSVRLSFFGNQNISDPKQMLRKDSHGHKCLLFRKPSDVDEKTVTNYIKKALKDQSKQ